MRILGIDPGLHITGYGLVETEKSGHRLIEAGVIRTDEKLPLASRLVQLSTDMEELLRVHSPDTVAVEDLYAHYDHPRTAIIMGHARGAILTSIARASIPVATYAATNIKKSLIGNGRASKAQIQQMIQVVFGLKKLPEPADAADALAVALCHARCGNHALIEQAVAR